MVHTRRVLTTILAIMCVLAFGSAFAKGHHHNNGAQLLGDRIKNNGQHMIHQVGEHKVFVQVSNGKVAGVNVKHSKKSDVPVKKYKTKKKMVQADGILLASYTLVQYQDIGMTYIGYSFIDEYGDEQIYWFPYEMILDGDTGAIDYVPLT